MTNRRPLSDDFAWRGAIIRSLSGTRSSPRSPTPCGRRTMSSARKTAGCQVAWFGTPNSSTLKPLPSDLIRQVRPADENSSAGLAAGAAAPAVGARGTIPGRTPPRAAGGGGLGTLFGARLRSRNRAVSQRESSVFPRGDRPLDLSLPPEPPPDWRRPDDRRRQGCDLRQFLPRRSFRMRRGFGVGQPLPVFPNRPQLSADRTDGKTFDVRLTLACTGVRSGAVGRALGDGR
jgi:hypothetical protein